MHFKYSKLRLGNPGEMFSATLAFKKVINNVQLKTKKKRKPLRMKKPSAGERLKFILPEDTTTTTTP